MVESRAFWKALHSLSHPLSIVAILVLLFNDHWLRHSYPSLLTGKLGDFTWLVFAPFIAGLLFAFFIPQKFKTHTKFVGILSIAFIGIWFATAKTIPVVHWLTTETLYAIVGYRGTLRMDMTDLLTLPALLFSWHIWRTSAETKINLKPIAYVAFGLGMLGTMASDGPYYEYRYQSTSVEVICELDDGRLFTSYGYDIEVYGYGGDGSDPNFSTDPTSDNFPNEGDPIIFGEYQSPEQFNYVSYDGGLSWIAIDGAIESNICSSKTEQIAIYPSNEHIQYRWERGRYIEQSINRGETWTRINNLAELKQEVRIVGNHDPQYSNLSPEPRYLESPVSGIVHSETGNLVLAMSLDGVLVITPEGDSQWVAVGDYQLDDLRNLSFISDALGVEYFLLPTLCFLILVSTVVLIDAERLLTRLWLIVGWVHWTILVITARLAFSPADFTQILAIWGLSALFSLFFIAIPMILWALWNLLRHYRGAILPILVSIVLASMGYILPLLLWTQGLIPRYYVAAIFSLLLTACVLWACYQHYRGKLPARYEPPKEKRKPKEV